MIRSLLEWVRPKPAPVPPGYVAVRPHVRAKPVNEKREALHAQLRDEVFPQGRGA